VAAEDESRRQPQPSLYLGVEVDEIIASIERSMGWMRRTKSPEATRLVTDLQVILDEIGAVLRGRGSG